MSNPNSLIRPINRQYVCVNIVLFKLWCGDLATQLRIMCVVITTPPSLRPSFPGIFQPQWLTLVDSSQAQNHGIQGAVKVISTKVAMRSVYLPSQATMDSSNEVPGGMWTPRW